MADEMRKQRAIAVDLFAGAGGMTLGFEQAGFDVLASVEIDPIHCTTHEFNFPYQCYVKVLNRQPGKKLGIGLKLAISKLMW